jgi:hypothetical protein
MMHGAVQRYSQGATVDRKSRRVLVFLSFAVFAQAGTAAAQCLTKPAKLAPALNGKEAYALARAEAAKWNADSVLTKMVTTSEGRLDAEGRASDWSIHFFSESAKKLNMLSFTKGAMTCTPIDRSSGGRPIAVSDTTVFDTRQLYDTAQQAGGSALDRKTVTVNADLGQNPRTGAVWHIDYYPVGGTGTLLSVVIDSATGKVISKTPK